MLLSFRQVVMINGGDKTSPHHQSAVNEQTEVSQSTVHSGNYRSTWTARNVKANQGKTFLSWEGTESCTSKRSQSYRKTYRCVGICNTGLQNFSFASSWDSGRHKKMCWFAYFEKENQTQKQKQKIKAEGKDKRSLRGWKMCHVISCESWGYGSLVET